MDNVTKIKKFLVEALFCKPSKVSFEIDFGATEI